ncbi:MAG TPA: heparan-alpha-glucosaminide N-acetyltransferase domain-containing protein [Anaeromyxobacteraceae bacterium]|nr:heparan-alpha-glucosaminide N-acetyltransferase domain-containing protein [Anaeromyxobacteraceae bacterium]
MSRLPATTGFTPPRKLWIDWERGLAVLLMVEAHAADAWLVPAAEGPLRALLHTMGGFAAPLFLFLAGLSQVLVDARWRQRGASARERRRKAVSRAFVLLGVAYVFRFSEYVLGGMYRVQGGWRDILRVDILNVIALSLAACAILATCLPGRWHLWLAALGAAALAFATPPVAQWQHSPSRLLDYLFASYPRANFSLFNWAGFLLAGSAAGRCLADRERPRLFFVLGAALLLAGWGGNVLPPFYRHQDFWHTSPSWFAIRLGAVIALTGGLQAAPAALDRRLSWLRTMGRHSLLGYFVSVELTYGFASRQLHKALSLPVLLVGIAAMTVLAWALSGVADHVEGRRPPARSGMEGVPSVPLMTATQPLADGRQTGAVLPTLRRTLPR